MKYYQQNICDLIQGKNMTDKEKALKEILEHIDSFHGSGHHYWWINSKIREKVYWMLARSLDNSSTNPSNTSPDTDAKEKACPISKAGY